MRSGNPVLSDGAFSRAGHLPGSLEAMSIQGTFNKTAILLVIVLASAVYTWSKFFQTGNPAAVSTFIIGGALVGFVLGLVTVFKMNWAPITAPLYSIAQGLFLGGISAIFEAEYPGIAFNAVLLTFGVALAMVVAFKTGSIKVTEQFRAGVVAATLGIALFYFITIILGFFGVKVPLLFGGGWVGIGFSVFVIIIAALNLVLDFDTVNQLAERGAPKYMEWYGAFSIMVTLIWLYLEILRLLAKLRGRD